MTYKASLFEGVGPKSNVRECYSSFGLVDGLGPSCSAPNKRIGIRAWCPG
jgi:hypothetical protein